MEIDIISKKDLLNMKEEILREVRCSIEACASHADEDAYLTSGQVMEILGVSDKQFAKYRQQRRIAFSQIGRKIYVKRSDLERFLDQYRVEARK